jgi:hypothetical protein
MADEGDPQPQAMRPEEFAAPRLLCRAAAWASLRAPRAPSKHVFLERLKVTTKLSAAAARPNPWWRRDLRRCTAT